MKRICLVAVLVLAMAAACGANDLEAVKSGTMTGYETTTVGQAFDASFDDPQWKAFETERGQRIVEFNGKVSKKLHSAFVAFMKANYSAEDIFNAAMLSGYPPPESESQYPAWEAAFLDTLWPAGAAFQAQWSILVDGSDAMQITYMGLDGAPIEDFEGVLALVFR